MSAERGKWERAVAALLAEKTIKDAAAAVGLSERQLRRWTKQPAFQAMYREARRRVVEQAVGRLQSLAGKAADALERNLGCGAPAVEVRAAGMVIDAAVRGVEAADLVGQVDELERRVREAEREREAAKRAGGGAAGGHQPPLPRPGPGRDDEDGEPEGEEDQ